MRLFCTAALVFVLGCDEGTTADPPVEPPTQTFEITATGRIIEGGGPFEGVRIVVPAGAVSDDQTLTLIQREGDPLPEGGLAVGPQFEIGPADLPLEAPLDVTLPFDPSMVVNAGGDVRGVKVWAVLGDGWTLLEAEVVGNDRVQLDLDTPTLVGAGIDLAE